MSMDSLTLLANKYGSDKGTEGPDKGWDAHNYTDIYEAYLWRRRNDPIRILEVGLGVTGESWRADIQTGRNQAGGASLKMWHDYFPNARIHGLDINPAHHLDNDRISTHIIDQGDSAQLQAFAKEFAGDGFDVIVDDGSHRPDHQQITLSILFYFLKPEGLYFIEDLMSNGIGDPDHGRFTDNSVVNTRRVLKHFAATGRFASPNKLSNPAGLAERIGGVRFHVPTRKIRLLPASNSWRKPSRLLQPTYSFGEDSETICVLNLSRQ